MLFHFSRLDVDEPLLHLCDALLAVGHLPHDEVEAALGEEVLVRRVVLVLQGANSIDIKNLGPVFGPVFRPILPVSICLPRPANLPIFNLTFRAHFRAHFRAIIYVN